MIYETKGLSLEEVDQLYEEVKDARKSKGWKPTTTREHRKEVEDHDVAKFEVETVKIQGRSPEDSN